MPPEYCLHEIVAAVPQLDEAQKRFDSLFPLGRGHAVKHAVQFHVFERGQFVVQAGVLEDDSEERRTCVLLRWRIVAIDAEVPLVGLRTVVSILMVVVFPAPLGPRKRENLALGNGERNMVHRAEIAELLDQVTHFDHRAHLDSESPNKYANRREWSASVLRTTRGWSRPGWPETSPRCGASPLQS